MRKLLAVLALALLTACASARPVAFQAPAPDGALDCALREATELGYYPLDGGKDAGFIKLARPTEYSAGDVAKEAGTRLMTLGLAGSNRQTMDHLTLTGAGGILRVQVVGIDEQDKVRDPDAASQERARTVLEACS